MGAASQRQDRRGFRPHDVSHRNLQPAPLPYNLYQGVPPNNCRLSFDRHVQPSHKDSHPHSQQTFDHPHPSVDFQNHRRLSNGRPQEGHPPDSRPPRRTYFSEYLPHIEELLSRPGQNVYYKGPLRVNKKRRTDAYVTVDGLAGDVYIPGSRLRNRAFDGDIVAIRLIDEEETAKHFPKEKFSRKMGGALRPRSAPANDKIGVPGSSEIDDLAENDDVDLDEILLAHTENDDVLVGEEIDGNSLPC